AKKPELAYLRDFRFLSVNSTALESGTSNVGSSATKLNALIELSKQNKIIWVVDQFTTLDGQGTSRNDVNDAFSRLMESLESGKMHMIGITTLDEYSDAFKSRPQLRRRFELVTKNPTTP